MKTQQGRSGGKGGGRGGVRNGAGACHSSQRKKGFRAVRGGQVCAASKQVPAMVACGGRPVLGEGGKGRARRAGACGDDVSDV